MATYARRLSKGAQTPVLDKANGIRGVSYEAFLEKEASLTLMPDDVLEDEFRREAWLDDYVHKFTLPSGTVPGVCLVTTDQLAQCGLSVQFVEDKDDKFYGHLHHEIVGTPTDDQATNLVLLVKNQVVRQFSRQKIS